ncbi:hypothetical protein D3C72_2470540 [compost metagenome]
MLLRLLLEQTVNSLLSRIIRIRIVEGSDQPALLLFTDKRQVRYVLIRAAKHVLQDTDELTVDLLRLMLTK